MAQSVSGGGQKPAPKGRVQVLGGNGKLVVEQVEIVRQREVIKVPELVVEQKKTVNYNVIEEPTIKYVPKEESTVCYKTTEEETVKYNPVEQETTKYVTKEVECEKPVVKEVEYEKPVISEKEYTLITYTELAAIEELKKMLPELKRELAELRKYKLVEEVVKVPKIQYVPTTVERVVWEDKARCQTCGNLVEGSSESN